MGCGATKVAQVQAEAKPAAVPPAPPPAPATSENTVAEPLGVPQLAASRLELLTDIFKALDTDGDGAITKEEFEERVAHPTLKSAFAFIDSQGNSDGMLQLDEWLRVIGQLGESYSDEAFEAEFSTIISEKAAEQLKEEAVAAMPELPASRLELLTGIFKALDTDGDGAITKEEFEERVAHPTLKSAFAFIDSQGNSDGMLQLDEWLRVIGQLGESYSDEAFEAEFSTIISEKAAEQLAES